MNTYLNPKVIKEYSIDSVKLNASTFKTINNDSIIGEGNIKTQSEVKLIKHNSSDNTVTLTNNTYHIFDKVESLNISLDETDDILNSFSFQFISPDTPTVLTMPAYICWETETDPKIESNYVYKITINNRLASIDRYIYNKEAFKHDEYKKYFTIEALEDGLAAKLSINACEYCVDRDDNWKFLTADSYTESINKGQTLSFRAVLTPIEYEGIGIFTISKKCNLKGNIMSLLYGNYFVDKIDLTGKNYVFNALFSNCANIVDASKLVLPATTLAIYCYSSMFHNCTGLTTAPELPATTLTYSCYSSMFHNCTGLTTAPELPATTLANGCYLNMFHNCTGLTTAPELPATTLTTYCYSNMFYDCSNLNYIKMLTTDISAYDCLYNWVSGVSSTGTFIKNPNMTSLPYGTSGIPTGWTVVDYQ